MNMMIEMRFFNALNIILTVTALCAVQMKISNAIYLFDNDDNKVFTQQPQQQQQQQQQQYKTSQTSLLRDKNDLQQVQYFDDSDQNQLKIKQFNEKLKINVNPSEIISQNNDSNSLSYFASLSSNVTLKRKRDTKLSLCESNCDCRRNNSFITVDCDLYQKGSQHIFGSRHEIPPTATSLIVRLGPSASLRLEEGLFYRSKINRMYFECKKDTNGQIEIRPDTFKGNLAPFPDIEIVNCYTVILRSNSFTGEFKLNITDCHDVIIYSDAFLNTAFPGFFHNIEDLRIHEQAFNKAKAKLDISNSKIDNLYRFEASLREIRFFNCSIGNINAGTFDVIAINSIIFESCKIDVIKTSAITEKLYSSHLAITGAVIGIIENEAINGSGITELILSRNEIDTVQEKAIYVTAINATVTHNRIKHLGNEWLRIREWSNITVAKNQFGDFGAIVLEKTSAAKSCIFEGNFITNPQPGSLNFTERRCIIRETSFYKQCMCKFDWLEKLSARDLRSEAYCQIDENLKFCFNTSIVNVLKYQHEVCDYTKTKLDCIKNINLKKIEGNFVQPEELEKSPWEKQKKLIYILVGIGILLVISGCVFILAQKVIRRPTSTISISDDITHINTAQHNSLNASGGATTLKELKIFSNEDRRIINQTLQMMKQKYPPEIFDLVYRNTQTLLQGNITEIQRVKTIGDIVQTLGECENAGEDFVAFTDILYKHLAPTTNNDNGNVGNILPDPVYAEPNLPNLNVIDVHNSNIDSQTNVDHIYAEPNSVQQPLLTNEYASPADRNELVDLYSEPISNEKVTEHTIIPAYAVTSSKEPKVLSSTTSLSTSSSSTSATSFPLSSSSSVIRNQNQHQQQQQQPSTSKNLPDVLNATSTSKPLTNVQKLAKNFANDPTFHITRSPNTNRRIPKYTVPIAKSKQNESKTDRNNYPIQDTQIPSSSSSNSSNSSSSSSSNNGNNPHGGIAMDSRSNHSGGSDITVKIDDIIEYADA